MKSLYIILVLSSITLFNPLSGQKYAQAFKNQDYETIRAMLSPEITVKLQKGKKFVGKEKSMAAIKRHLTKFNPTTILTKHKGSNTDNDNYVIAELGNADNERIRLLIHFENSAEGRRICDLKIRRI